MRTILLPLALSAISLIFPQRATEASEEVRLRNPMPSGIQTFPQGRIQAHGSRRVANWGKEYLVLDISVWNDGDQPLSFTTFDRVFELLDDEGRTYRWDNFISGMSHDQAISDVPPREKRRGEFPFLRPKDTPAWLLFYPPTGFFEKRSAPVKILVLEEASGELDSYSSCGDDWGFNPGEYRLRRNATTAETILMQSGSSDDPAGLDVEWLTPRKDTTRGSITRTLRVTNKATTVSIEARVYVPLPRACIYERGTATHTQDVSPLIYVCDPRLPLETAPVDGILWSFERPLAPKEHAELAFTCQ